jgi:hypothetical protein
MTKNKIFRVSQGANMRYRRLNWIFITAVFLLSFLFSAAEARGVGTAPQIVDGIITDVSFSGASIEVNGVNYDISHAVIVTSRGTRVTRDVLGRGDRVEMVIEGGEVTKIRVGSGNGRMIIQ